MPSSQKLKQSALKNQKLSKEHWIHAARKILINSGVQKISLRKLSESMSVTTGAFYWQFENLEELFDAIRDDWVTKNTALFTEIFENDDLSGEQKWFAYAREVIIENNFDPRYDNAMRDWASTSKRTARLVKKIDSLRVDQLKKMLEQMGYDSDHALIRARVTYFHQCGYYSMGIEESTEERLRRAPLYAEILIGKMPYSSSSDIDVIRNDIMNG